MRRMFQVKAKILSNKKIKDNYLHCILNAGKIAKDARPGQFVNIRISDTLDPLLRRPLSIHVVRGFKIEILYEVVGKSTRVLSEKKPGEVFLETVATENIPPPPPPAEPEKKKKASLNVKQYLPLIDTLRLYAGNLFAWYAIVMALGYYVHVRALPFSIPFVGGLFISSIVFRC